MDIPSANSVYYGVPYIVSHRLLSLVCWEAGVDASAAGSHGNAEEHEELFEDCAGSAAGSGIGASGTNMALSAALSAFRSWSG